MRSPCAEESTAESVPPNLLVVLDRSCSMTAMVGGQTKWQIAVAALSTMTTAYGGKIRFGLTLFPDLDAPDCQQSTIEIPTGADKLVANYCARGVTVQYVRMPVGEHVEFAVRGGIDAAAYLSDRFAGAAPPSNCAA